MPRPEPAAFSHLAGLLFAIGHLNGSGYHESAFERLLALLSLSPLTSFLLGVISTVIGSYVASKFHVYHDARNAHRDDIKKQVLEPLSNALRQTYASLAQGTMPVARLSHGVFPIDYSVRAEDEVMAYTDYVVCPHPQDIHDNLSKALLFDSIRRHHIALMKAWLDFCKTWLLHLSELTQWIDELRTEIETRSNLPLKPARPRGSYAMHLHLAMFIYERLFKLAGKSLRIDEMNPGHPDGRFRLTDGTVSLAAGSGDEAEMLLALVNELMSENVRRATELRKQLGSIRDLIEALSGEFSAALAAKRLHRRCDLVSFF